MNTKEKISAALAVIRALADSIKELGEVPSGHLYARVMDKIDLETYSKAIEIIKAAGLVTESNNLLKWAVKDVA